MADVSLSPRNKIGLTLAFLLGMIWLPMFLRGAPDPGEIGPPMTVLITESICGLVTVVAVAIGWRRGSARAIRLAAGAQIVSVLTAVPVLPGPSSAQQAAPRDPARGNAHRGRAHAHAPTRRPHYLTRARRTA